MAQTIKSQLTKTINRRTNPTADPYVDEGDEVSSGDVV